MMRQIAKNNGSDARDTLLALKVKACWFHACKPVITQYALYYTDIEEIKKPPRERGLVVTQLGLEPRTLALKGRCSTN